MHRFFVPPQTLTADLVRLPSDVARQMTQVLRLRAGEDIVLFDGSGDEWTARIDRAGGEEVTVAISERRTPATEPAVKVTLSQALLKSDRFEFVLQKATELGAFSFQPVATNRSVAGRPSPSRISRWKRIVREAAEQSGRVRVPELLNAVDLPAAAESSLGTAVVLWEGERQRSLRAVLGDLRDADHLRVNLIVGPEGGLEKREVEILTAEGAAVAGLGRRVLRSETASIAALAVLMYELRELDPR